MPYYFGRWHWIVPIHPDTGEPADDGYWASQVQDVEYAAVDMRTMRQQSAKGGQGEHAFFHFPEPVRQADLVSCGNSLGDQLSDEALLAIASNTNLVVSRGDTLASVLRQALVVTAKRNDLDARKPVRPERGNVYVIWVGPEGVEAR